MNEILDLDIAQVIVAFAFVLMVLFIVRKRRITREKEILISSLRMTVQLILAGFALTYIFRYPHPLVTVGIIVLMEFFAIYTVFGKFKGQLSTRLKKTIALSMITGTMTCLLYFLLPTEITTGPWASMFFPTIP